MNIADRAITYEAFGAAGDGVQNDMPSIVAAHEEANRLGLPVRAKEGAVYFIAPQAATAVIRTDTDWTGATFRIDDRDLDDFRAPIFDVPPAGEEIPFALTTLKAGQTKVVNPTGQTLFVSVRNDRHRDFIRFGGNQDNGSPRHDSFLVNPDGSMPSPVTFDFDEITACSARTLPDTTLTIRGGTFVTIANRRESKYDYHGRNIRIRRSKTDVSGITHLVTDELDHGAPYGGFLTISDCAKVEVRDCLLTGHRIYYTMGTGGVVVPMGSYDINCGGAAEVTFRRVTQTTDIMDRNYWGLIGTNHCRDLVFEDCVLSRFDAHTGVTNCTIRRCRLGWQCLNAIGCGTFVIEDTEAFGYAFVNLRDDYGCTWRGDFVIRDCIWHPAGAGRTVFRAHNRGTHDFGYPCYLPARVSIDGLTVPETQTLAIFNDWGEEPDAPYPMIKPAEVSVKNVRGAEHVLLCENPDLLDDTAFSRA
ncbi:MAG: hypothetical protein K6G29_00025 [Clostridiales bacterium]|nr:hypothetical protein [Clostridiales bacterium]